MGCLVSKDEETQNDDSALAEPEEDQSVELVGYQGRAKALLEATDFDLLAALDLLGELEAIARPARKRCRFGSKCYRKNPKHKAEFCHPADPDWNANQATAKPANIEQVQILMELYTRSGNEIALALGATPSSGDVFARRAVLSNGKSEEESQVSLPGEVGEVEDAEGEDGETGVEDRPPPLDGSTDDVPLDLEGFSSGLRDESVSGCELAQRVAAVRLWDSAAKLGFLDAERTHDEACTATLKEAGEAAAARHLAWAESAGQTNENEQRDVLQGDGLLYGLFVAHCLGMDDAPEFENASVKYRQALRLPEYWDLSAAAAAVRGREEDGGRRRQAWLAFEQAIAGCEDGKISAQALDEANIAEVFTEGDGDAPPQVREFVLMLFSIQMEKDRPNDDTLEAATAFKEAVADESEDASVLAVVTSTSPTLQHWDLLGRLGLQGVSRLIGSALETARAYLVWAGETATEDENDVLQYALYISYCLHLGGAELEAEDEEERAKAAQTLRELKGLAEWWHPRVLFSTYEDAATRLAWAQIEALASGRLEHRLQASAAEPALRLLADGAGASEGSAREMLAECLMLGLKQEPLDRETMGSIFAQVEAGDEDAQQLQSRLVPWIAWWHLVVDLDFEGRCQDDANSVYERLAVEAADVVTEAVDGGEETPQMRASLYVASKFCQAVGGDPCIDDMSTAFAARRSLGNLPLWWDVPTEVAAYGGGVESSQAWSSLKTWAGNPPLNAGDLAESLTEGEGSAANVVYGSVFKMLLSSYGSYPKDFNNEVEAFQAWLVEPNEETGENIGGVGVLGIMKLKTGLLNYEDRFEKDEHVWPDPNAWNDAAAGATMRYCEAALSESTLEALRFGVYVADQLNRGEDVGDVPILDLACEEFRRLRCLPEGWDVRAMISNCADVAVCSVWAKAEELAAQTEPVAVEDTCEALRQFCADGHGSIACMIIRIKLAQAAEGCSPDEEVTEVPPEGPRAMIACVAWWDVANAVAEDAELDLAELEHFKADAVKRELQAPFGDGDPQPKLLHRGIFAASCLECGESDVEAAVAAYRYACSLPSWYKVNEAAQSFGDPEMQDAWIALERYLSSGLDLTEARETLEEAGVNEDASRKVLQRTLACKLASLPTNPRKEVEVFTQAFMGGADAVQLCATVSAIALYEFARSSGVWEASEEEGEVSEEERDLLIDISRRYLRWALDDFISNVEEVGEMTARVAALFALFAASCLCTEERGIPMPEEFDEVAQWYCGSQGMDASHARTLVSAYIIGGAAASLEPLLANDGPVDCDEAEAQLRAYTCPSKSAAALKVGEDVDMPSEEEILEACRMSKMAEVNWKKSSPPYQFWMQKISDAAGNTCKIVDFKGETMKVKTPQGTKVSVGVGAARTRQIDETIRPRVASSLFAIMSEPHDVTSEEKEAFAEAVSEGGQGASLAATLRIVTLWDLAVRMKLQEEESLKDIVKVAAGRHLSEAREAAEADPSDKTSLQVGLFIASRLNATDLPEFEAAADMYREIRRLPDVWDVGAMVAAYEDGAAGPGSLWERAEKALAGTEENPGPDLDLVDALLSEAAADEKDGQPWICLSAAFPDSVPQYWDFAGYRGTFDKMIPLAVQDPLGRPSEVYPAVQALVDGTWKEIATRDRPCPKKSCKPRPGGCPCVQKGGDPGMPEGIKVRRILRIEDSGMWATYIQKRAEIRDKRDSAPDPALEAKTAPFLADERCAKLFDTLDAGANEVYLFHGTFVRAALSIAQNGFSIDLAGSNVGTMYGRGGYFCECVSKADEYAKDEPGGYYEGIFAVLLCRVAMGQPYVTDRRDEEARRHTLSGEKDSTLGDREKSVNTYREFVVYDLDQVYPEYCILYERVGKGYECGGTTWGALQEGSDKVVLEVPSDWENAHVNPRGPGFSQVLTLPRLMKDTLEHLVIRLEALADRSTELRVKRAERVEASGMWLGYLGFRRRLQERGVEPMSEMLGDHNATMATEKALMGEVLRGTGRPRCRYGARCYRKNKQHFVETCHPNDPDWNLSDSCGGGALKGKLADVAAWLLEAIDQSIEESYLWCSASEEHWGALLETGVEPLFTPVEGCGVPALCLYESPGACLEHDGADEGRILLLCRALCGTALATDNLEDAEAVAEACGEEKDCLVETSGEMRKFAVFSPQQVYPEFAILLA